MSDYVRIIGRDSDPALNSLPHTAYAEGNWYMIS